MVLTDQLQTAKDSLAKATKELEIEKRKVCFKLYLWNPIRHQILLRIHNVIQSEDVIGKARQRERIHSTVKGISTAQKAMVSFKL